MRRFVLIAWIACGPKSLPTPEYTMQMTTALSEVPYDPPPARVEFIPARPNHPDAVWIDGEWSWQGRRWAWKHGRWVVPPANAKFAPWTTVRDAAGTLFMASGTWRDRFGIEVNEPSPLAISKTLPGAIIDSSGTQVQASTVPTSTQPALDASVRVSPPDGGLDEEGFGDMHFDAAAFDGIPDPSTDASTHIPH